MNSEQNDFRQLRRLLALKRYEQPPPGYFSGFSHEVLVRIRAGERIDHFSIWEALSWDAPWIQKIWASLERRPALAGAFGLAICGLLVVGTLNSEPNRNTLIPAGDTLATVPGPQPADLRAGVAVDPLMQQVAVTPYSGVAGLPPSAANDSLFQQLKDSQQPRVELINATVPR